MANNNVIVSMIPNRRGSKIRLIHSRAGEIGFELISKKIYIGADLDNSVLLKAQKNLLLKSNSRC